MKRQTKLSKTSKKILTVWVAVLMIAGIFASCSSANNSNKDGESSGANQSKGAISVVTREDGSGTRGAFIELFGIEEKDSAGNKIDNTIDSAETTNSTAVMLTTIAGNKSSIGYVSLGSLDSSVKALKVDGIEPTSENVKNLSYKVARPFNIVTKEKISDAATDFINFIQSDDGQKIVENNGYVSKESTGVFTSNGASGKITVAGSSSVTPVMEKLKEAYLKLNTKSQIEIQQSDSTTGVTSAIDSICDIGMASRELKDTETAKGVKSTVIAMDGIAVIVNNNSALSQISSSTVKGIYTGTITDWADVK